MQEEMTLTDTPIDNNYRERHPGQGKLHPDFEKLLPSKLPLDSHTLGTSTQGNQLIPILVLPSLYLTCRLSTLAF